MEAAGKCFCYYQSISEVEVRQKTGLSIQPCFCFRSTKAKRDPWAKWRTEQNRKSTRMSKVVFPTELSSNLMT